MLLRAGGHGRGIPRVVGEAYTRRGTTLPTHPGIYTRYYLPTCIYQGVPLLPNIPQGVPLLPIYLRVCLKVAVLRVYLKVAVLRVYLRISQEAYRAIHQEAYRAIHREVYTGRYNLGYTHREV